MSRLVVGTEDALLRISDDLLSNGVIEDVISIEVIDDSGELYDVRDDDETTIPIGATSDAQAHANEQGE